VDKFFGKGREMVLIKCFDCSKGVSPTALACPHCGASISGRIAKMQAESNIMMLKIPLFFAQVGLLGGIALFFYLCRDGMPLAKGPPSLLSFWDLFYGISPVATIMVLVSMVIGMPIALIIKSISRDIRHIR